MQQSAFLKTPLAEEALPSSTEPAPDSGAPASGGSSQTAASVLGDDLGDADNVRKLRVWKRREVSVSAHVVSGNSSLPITISDVSVMGVGFRGQTGLADWTAIEVRLPDGRSLPGTLVWSHNGRGGIELETPLEADDPLFGQLDDGPRKRIQYQGMKADTEGVSFSMIRAAWQRLTSATGQSPTSTPGAQSQKSVERACRKQGFSWMTDED